MDFTVHDCAYNVTQTATTSPLYVCCSEPAGDASVRWSDDGRQTPGGGQSHQGGYRETTQVRDQNPGQKLTRINTRLLLLNREY